MTGWTKLFSSIVTSSVWVEDDATLRVWIAMLATADANGVVEASIPGLASLCRLSVETAEAAIQKLAAPDRFSRSPENDGRRITAIEGGWLITNYAKYRRKRDPEERRQQVRDAVARYRSRKRQPDVIRGNQSKPRKAQAEAEAEAERIPEPPPTPSTLSAVADQLAQETTYTAALRRSR